MDSRGISNFVGTKDPMKSVDRRSVLRYAGIMTASLALRKGLWASFAAQNSSAGTATAKTEYGSISGAQENGINVFRSVPYGGDTFPVRFQAPRAPTPWTGVKACDAFTTRAPQLAALRGLAAVHTIDIPFMFDNLDAAPG